jgi:group I intron endonuclease
MKGIVYLVTNQFDGKCYVGRTINSLKYRKRKHEQPSCNKSENTYHFHNALQKYGKENFLWEILEEVECESKKKLNTILNKYEEYYIEVLDAMKNGYNLTAGGDGTVGMIVSEETRKKMSITRTGKKINHPKGVIKHTEEAKKKISLSRLGEKNPMYGKTPWNKGLKGYMVPWNIGVPMTNEVKEKVSKNRKGKTAGENHPMYGKHHTEEANRKNSEAHKGIPIHENTRKALLKANIGSIPWNKGLTKETDERVRKIYEK